MFRRFPASSATPSSRARLRSLIAAPLAGLFLAACGGGGGGEGSISGPGGYLGTYADGTAMDPVSRAANPNCVAGDRPVFLSGSSTPAGVRLTPAFANLALDLPIGMWQPRDDSNRWFLAEKDGRLYSFANTETATATLVLDIRDRVNANAGEGGFLGVAIDPSFAANGRVYVSYTANGANGSALTSRISRFTSRDGGKTLDKASEEVLLSLGQPEENHNGGNIAFGPDGYLYIGFGDGGGAGDPRGYAQNPGVLFGKLLRIDVSGSGPYTVPADNPFVSQEGTRPEIYALGFRNPWRWSFDLKTGDLWMGDVGETTREEINKVRAGGNYGWRIKEGSTCFNNNAACAADTSIAPLADYGHENGRCSITGGYLYRGANMPELQGQYVYADFCTGEMWSLKDTPNATPVQISSGGSMPVSFAQANDGTLYAVSFGPARVYRLEAASASAATPFPRTVAASGCFNTTRANKMGSAMVPYDVNVPFWSDGGVKDHYFALPDGTRLSEGTDGQLVFPIGSVVVKNVSLAGKLLESRVMMRHTDGEWGAYSYEWNDSQTDASLVLGGKDRVVNGQTWRFPTEAECLRCHTSASGRIIAAETLQTHRNRPHPTTGKEVNQLSLWRSMSLSDVLPDGKSALPDIHDANVPLANRARAWLHANCSYCHRPGGGTSSAMDLRYDTPLASTRACGATPTAGTLGLADAKLIKPGAPASSVLLERIRRLDAYRMPPLGSAVVDVEGAQMLEAWIASLGACN